MGDGDDDDARDPDEIDLREQAEIELREEPAAQPGAETRRAGRRSGQPREPQQADRRGRPPEPSAPAASGAPGFLILMERPGLCTLHPAGAAHLEPGTETTEHAVRQLEQQGWRVVRTDVRTNHKVTILGQSG